MILLVSIFTGFGLPGWTFSNASYSFICLFLKDLGSYWMRLIMSLFWFRATGFEAIFCLFFFVKNNQKLILNGTFSSEIDDFKVFGMI